MITFTIDGTSYQAEDGMTWEQWIESEYNTVGAEVLTSTTITIEGFYLYKDSSAYENLVNSSHNVIENGTYITSGLATPI